MEEVEEVEIRHGQAGLTLAQGTQVVEDTNERVRGIGHDEVVEVGVRAVDNTCKLRMYKRVETSLEIAVSACNILARITANTNRQVSCSNQELLGHVVPEAADYLPPALFP